VIQDEAVEWLEEVRLAYRTDPFTAVISDLINAGANNGAAARALPASVQRELMRSTPSNVYSMLDANCTDSSLTRTEFYSPADV
jgi:hypothetical protein